MPSLVVERDVQTSALKSSGGGKEKKFLLVLVMERLRVFEVENENVRMENSHRRHLFHLLLTSAFI